MRSAARLPQSEKLGDSVDIAIIGAGPQALTLVTHLLQKRENFRQRFVVIDPAGTWLSHWQQQFAAQEIPHLRSPAVHHPDPNPHALRGFAEARPDELHPPYGLPGTQLFHEFCQEVIRRWHLQERVVAATVVGLEPLVSRALLQPPFKFRLALADGRIVRAKRVVLATGNGPMHWPDWVPEIPTGYPGERLQHSSQVDLRQLSLAGERILIVGGGLTSGHLAVGAFARGAKVALMARRQVCEKLFDAEPGWLGPKYLNGFWAEPDWQKRFAMIQAARNGGSFTPAMLTQLRRLERTGNLTIYEQCQVRSAHWQGGSWGVSCAHTDHHACLQDLAFDRIWLATGHRFDANRHPLLQSVHVQYPIELVQGLPVLDEALSWPGCDLFIMGGLAALQLGPTARNLSGGIRASHRIVPMLIKPRWVKGG
jgi:FAD-NAD(P)-binding